MEKMKELIEDYLLKILLGLCLLIFILIGLLLFPLDRGEKDIAPVDLYEELLADEADDEAPSVSDAIIEELVPIDIMVDVKGAVNRPGVYKMHAGDRIIDAIEMADGLLDKAEEKSVNLAQMVVDEMVIYVPEIGEEGADVLMTSPPSKNEVQEDKIDINQADKNALMTLQGIGNSKAEGIIRHRDEHGLFQTLEDIKEVSGIGEATFNNIKDDIKISP